MTPQARTDGGPAFPYDWKDYTPSEGMSLRDWFAGQALGPLVSNAIDLNHRSWAATVDHAYLIADAMLAARSKQQ